MPPTKVGILGAGFIADVHLESYTRFVPDAQVTAVYSRKKERAEQFGKHWTIPQVFTDLDHFFAEADCEVVDICLPNFLHHKATLGAAYSGRMYPVPTGTPSSRNAAANTARGTPMTSASYSTVRK